MPWTSSSLLVLFENAQGMPELGVDPFKMFLTGLQLPLQMTMMHTALNRSNQQARPLVRADEEIGGPDAQSGFHTFNVAVFSEHNHRHLNIKVAHCPAH